MYRNEYLFIKMFKANLYFIKVGIITQTPVMKTVTCRGHEND
jgi:hypothetical protein